MEDKVIELHWCCECDCDTDHIRTGKFMVECSICQEPSEERYLETAMDLANAIDDLAYGPDDSAMMIENYAKKAVAEYVQKQCVDNEPVEHIKEVCDSCAKLKKHFSEVIVSESETAYAQGHKAGLVDGKEIAEVVHDIIVKKNLRIPPIEKVQEVVAWILHEHPDKREQLITGNRKIFGWLIGQVFISLPGAQIKQIEEALKKERLKGNKDGQTDADTAGDSEMESQTP